LNTDGRRKLKSSYTAEQKSIPTPDKSLDPTKAKKHNNLQVRPPEILRFLGPPTKFEFDLAPGLWKLIEIARGQRRNRGLSPDAQIKASREALQQIADHAVGYFHAVVSFAATGQAWAARMLAEFAVAGTSVLEGVIAGRPRDPMKPVSLWQSPEDRIKNDAHTLLADNPFAAILSLFRNERQLPVLIRRHAKAFNTRKLKLAEVVQLGAGLGERIGNRKYRNPEKPLNKVLDRYLPFLESDPKLPNSFSLLQTKAGCRKCALRLLEVFEENNGPAIKHKLFADVLRNGPPTDKGKRGAIRDAIQDSLFSRYKSSVTGSHKPYISHDNNLDTKRIHRRSVQRDEKLARQARKKK
jgi:hypothetical protein